MDQLQDLIADNARLRREIGQMREERDGALADLADWRDSAARAACEPCPDDEKHCTCVGPLRKMLIDALEENARLLAKLRKALALVESAYTDGREGRALGRNWLWSESKKRLEEIRNG